MGFNSAFKGLRSGQTLPNFHVNSAFSSCIQLLCPNSPFSAQWSLYVPPGLWFKNSTFCPQTLFMCFVWVSE